MAQQPKLSSGLFKNFSPALFESVITVFQRSLPTLSVHPYFGLFTPPHPSGLEIKNLWHFFSPIFVIQPAHVYLQSCIMVETSRSYKTCFFIVVQASLYLIFSFESSFQMPFQNVVSILRHLCISEINPVKDMMVTSSPQPLDEDNVLLSSFNNTCSPDYE
jgi:hypothetical protein